MLEAPLNCRYRTLDAAKDRGGLVAVDFAAAIEFNRKPLDRCAV